MRKMLASKLPSSLDLHFQHVLQQLMFKNSLGTLLQGTLSELLIELNTLHITVQQKHKGIIQEMLLNVNMLEVKLQQALISALLLILFTCHSYMAIACVRSLFLDLQYWFCFSLLPTPSFQVIGQCNQVLKLHMGLGEGWANCHKTNAKCRMWSNCWER